MRVNLSSARRLLVATVVVLLVITTVLTISMYLSGCGSGGGGGITPPQKNSMATPVITPATGSETSCSLSVSITDATAGAVIHYTTDGSIPTSSSATYSKAFSVNCPTTGNTVTIEAYAPAESSSYTDSEVAIAKYTFAVPTSAPVFTPADGSTVKSGQTVSISDSSSGAIVYYTLDGTTPTTKSTKYTGPFTIGGPTASPTTIVLKAFAAAADANHLDSSVTTVTYNYDLTPTIKIGTLPTVTLNATNVALPVTTTNCSNMKYTISPDFPVLPSDYGVMGSITFPTPCNPVFSPGTTMPSPSAEYTVTFTAIGVQGTGSASADLTIHLTTPAITMDPKTPMSPTTAPAGNGDVITTFHGVGCPFVSWNMEAYGTPDYWTGTMVGSVSVQTVINSGERAGFTDCNHVFDDTSYHGTLPGDIMNEFLVNPTPGGGSAGPFTLTFVATSTSSSIATNSDGSVATLSQKGNTAKTNSSVSRSITFGKTEVSVPDDVQQLLACGLKTLNFCALGKSQLTMFNASGVPTKSYNLPEDVSFAIANNNGTYVFANSGKLYKLEEKKGFTHLAGFSSSNALKTAALSNKLIAALSTNGQVKLYDTVNDILIGSFDVPAGKEMNNIAFTADGYIVLGKLNSKGITLLDTSGNVTSYNLPAALLTLTQSGDEVLASLSNGKIVAVDSYGNVSARAHALKAEDLYAGFRISGRTLVLAPALTSGSRQARTLPVD